MLPGLVAGPLVAVWGLLFLVFRRPISDAARSQRMRRGYSIGPNTQSPFVIGLGGAVFLAAGLFITIGTLTGFLHPHA